MSTFNWSCQPLSCCFDCRQSKPHIAPTQQYHMGTFSPSSLAIPAVVLLISFLSFTSQILFAYIDPHPLRHNESITFNVLIACIFVTYFRACFTDPGRIPKDWRETLFRKRKSVEAERSEGNGALAIDGCDPNKRLGEYGAKERWCRKCDAAKPPRAHHCKSCKRWGSKFSYIRHATSVFCVLCSHFFESLIDAFGVSLISVQGFLVKMCTKLLNTSYRVLYAICEINHFQGNFIHSSSSITCG